MTYLYWILGVYCLISIIGIIWFVNSLGRKNMPDEWYDHIFYPTFVMALPVIWTIILTFRLIDFVFERGSK